MALRIRPAYLGDHAEILALAALAGTGMSSLPQDSEVLYNKITHSVQSFEGRPHAPEEEAFLFVLEDTVHHRLAGTCGIVAHVGLRRPFYSYKLSTLSQASREAGVYSLQQVLHMVNDYTGASEIGSLFLHPDYHHGGSGRLLSRSRYMMLAEYPHLFADMVISEIRGVQDDDHHSPFYDNLARHFFKMDFAQADYIYATQGAQFIADLMPKYPIYVNLLSEAAQNVIGVPFASSRPAMELLQAEGFEYQGYVDLFDAGPTLQAKRDNIKTVRDSKKAQVVAIGEVEEQQAMIANTRLEDFTVTRGSIKVMQEGIILATKSAEILGVQTGDWIRYAP